MWIPSHSSAEWRTSVVENQMEPYTIYSALVLTRAIGNRLPFGMCPVRTVHAQNQRSLEIGVEFREKLFVTIFS